MRSSVSCACPALQDPTWLGCPLFTYLFLSNTASLVPLLLNTQRHRTLEHDDCPLAAVVMPLSNSNLALR